jgi:hypothetical protein
MSRTKITLVAVVSALLIAACSSSHKTGGTSTGTTTPPVATTPAAATTSSATTPTTSSAPSTTAAASGALSGTWSGHYSGAYQGTFTLTWQQSGSILSGSITLSTPPSTLNINGTVAGGAIRFGTVGSVGISYSGTASGNSMSGTYQVQGGGSSTGGPWSATKAS